MIGLNAKKKRLKICINGACTWCWASMTVLMMIFSKKQSNWLIIEFGLGLGYKVIKW